MVMPAGASPKGPASKSPLRLKSPQSYKLFFIPANIFRAAPQLNKQACQRVAKQSHLAVCLSSKSRGNRIHNPTPLRPTNGQNVDGVRRPKTDDLLFMTRAGLSANLLPLAKKKP